MKKNNQNLLFIALSILFLSSGNLLAQDAKVTVSEDPKFENLLKEKRRINSSITVNDRYKIQIFNGDSETSKKMLNDFKRQYKNFDGTIIFNTPFYKVWVGNLRQGLKPKEIWRTSKKTILMRF